MTTNYHERNHWIGTDAEMALCAPANPGAVWFQANTGNSFWWNGANWIAVGGGGIGPPTEGPGIDVIATQVGLGGDTVLIYDDGGLPVAEFATITLAMAAAVAGQLVQTPPGTFTESFTIPVGVGLVSIGNNTIVAGTITLGGASSYMKGITVNLVGNSGGTLVGVIGPAAGSAIIRDCGIVVTNNGAGDAYGVQSDTGAVEIRDSSIDTNANSGDAVGIYSGTVDLYSFHNNLICTSISGDGYCFVPGGDGDIYAIGGYAWASTSPIGATP